MEHIPVVMVRKHMHDIPTFACPSGYSLRRFREGDAEEWARVETAAGEFQNEASARQRFDREFGDHLSQMEERCYFMEDGSGRVIGTATAWYNASFEGEPYGRLHWVAVHPEYQGKGLAKPLVAAAVNRLAELHHQSCLTTQTTSYKAIKIYLDFGFVPLLLSEQCGKGWSLLQAKLQHPALEAFKDI